MKKFIILILSTTLFCTSVLCSACGKSSKNNSLGVSSPTISSGTTNPPAIPTNRVFEEREDFTPNYQTQKIEVTEDMIIDCIGLGYPEKMFDEQDRLDPATNGTTYPTASAPNSLWNWRLEFNLYTVVYLEAEFFVEDVYVYSRPWQEERSLGVYAGTPFSWEYEETMTFPRAGDVWYKLELNKATRFLGFECNNNEAPYEIVIYGYKLSADDGVPVRQQHANKPIDQLIGMNMNLVDVCNSGNDMTSGYHENFVNPASYLREYHNYTHSMEGDEYSYLRWGGYWNFDTMYQFLSEKGYYTVPTIQGMNKTDYGLGNDPSITYNPLSYDDISEYVYQYAARYGSKTIDESKLKVANGGGGKRSGLNYLKTLEIGNELNNNWTNEGYYFTPIETSAMLSACYDGHKGAMGDGYGIKTADPDMTVSMTGLAGINLDYIKAMALWSEYQRGKEDFPAEIFNVHEYCTKQITYQGHLTTVGISPEEYGLLGMMEEVVEFRDRYYPTREVWLTEFGWDTSQNYDIETSAHAYGSYTGRQVQAMWLVRSYLLLSSTSVDRLAMFFCQDGDTEDGATIKYSTCGIKTINGEKKDSYYYLKTLSTVMNGMSFSERINVGNDDIYVYKYVDDNGQVALACWSGTSNSTVINNFTLNLNGFNSASLIQFADNQEAGVSSNLPINNGQISFTLSECPVIIKLN